LTIPWKSAEIPLSHLFIERLIGTIRRECLDRTLFWTAADSARLAIRHPQVNPVAMF
jgi:hypothetical protein